MHRFAFGQVVLVLPLAFTVAACVSVTPAPSSDAGPRRIVGVSWGDLAAERWKADEAGLRDALATAGVTYLSTDAHGSPEAQATDLTSLIAQGARVLIVVAADAEGIAPAVRTALDGGVPVIGYDRLIEDADTFYISFDNVEVGRLQATAVLGAAPRGKYVLIEGDRADPNSAFVARGQHEVLEPAIESGVITIVGESYTPWWDPVAAQEQMERDLVANGDDVQAVLAANDGMAGGVVAALTAHGMAGRIPVSGQDGNKLALNRVAQGTQTVSVWKDGRALGRAAAAVAIELIKGTPVEDVPSAMTFTDGPRSVPVSTILLPPIAITQDNLDVVIDAGWILAAEVCQGVTPGSVRVCPDPA